MSAVDRVARVAERRLEFAQSLQRFRADQVPAAAALAKVPPLLLLGTAVVAGTLVGRVFGLNKLLAPKVLIAGFLEQQLVKALLGGGQRLWNLHGRASAAPEDPPTDGPVAHDPDRVD